jgi:predicted dehydrogenase
LSRSLNGGGIMANWGCYDLDYLLGTVGWQLKPESVYAQAWPVAPHLRPHVAPGSDAETHVTALIRCAGGAVITLERGEYLPSPREGAWQITGTKGTLRLSMTPQQGNSVLLDICGDDGTTTETVWTGDEENAEMPVGLLTDFAHAVRTNGKPLTTLENALVIQQITDAIYESAEKDTLVSI